MTRSVEVDTLTEMLERHKKDCNPDHFDGHETFIDKIDAHDGADVMDVLKMTLFSTFMKEILHYTPCVDAVPVVRCKDCKYSVDHDNDGDYYCVNPKWGLSYFGSGGEFYCAGAERKEK